MEIVSNPSSIFMLSKTVESVHYIYLPHLTLHLLSRKSLTPFVSNVRSDLAGGAVEHHQGTGSEKFSAKVAGARIKFQVDTWWTSWPPGARSEVTRGGVAGSPASCQVVEARQETETDWGGVRLHHVCPLCSPAGREGGRGGRPHQQLPGSPAVSTDGRCSLPLLVWEAQIMIVPCQQQPAARARWCSALFRMTQGISSSDRLTAMVEIKNQQSHLRTDNQGRTRTDRDGCNTSRTMDGGYNNTVRSYLVCERNWGWEIQPRRTSLTAGPSCKIGNNFLHFQHSLIRNYEKHILVLR